MLHLVSGISSLYLFINIILVPVPPFPTHLFLHPKPTSFINPTPVVSLLPPGLPSQTVAGTVSSKLFGFCFFFSFSIFCVSVPYTRLSWPSRQLLSTRKSTVSYRIVSYTCGISERRKATTLLMHVCGEEAVVSVAVLATVDGRVNTLVAQVRVQLVNDGRTHANEVNLTDAVRTVIHVKHVQYLDRRKALQRNIR